MTSIGDIRNRIRIPILGTLASILGSGTTAEYKLEVHTQVFPSSPPNKMRLLPRLEYN